MKRIVAAESTGVKYRDMTDVEMDAFFSAGKRNIFAFGEKALSSGSGLYSVLNRIQTLRTHGQGYAREAVWLASQGSPQEINAFVDGMFKELDDDCQQLVKVNLGAMNIPEPWKSISAEYFLKK